MKVEKMVKDLRAYNISPHDADHAADLLEAQGAVIARYMNLCRDVLDMDRLFATINPTTNVIARFIRQRGRSAGSTPRESALMRSSVFTSFAPRP